jgi:hypothetical protein
MPSIDRVDTTREALAEALEDFRKRHWMHWEDPRDNALILKIRASLMDAPAATCRNCEGLGYRREANGEPISCDLCAATSAAVQQGREALPRLPEPLLTTPITWGNDGRWWSESQMQEYARAALAHTPQAPQPTDLHAAIMNLPCNVPSGYPYGSELCAGVYREGHRDARHAAAKLVAALLLPAQAPAVPPLTPERIAEIAEQMEASDPTDSFWLNFARAIEAAQGASTSESSCASAPNCPCYDKQGEQISPCFNGASTSEPAPTKQEKT